MADLPYRREHITSAAADRAQRSGQDAARKTNEIGRTIDALPFSKGWVIVSGIAFAAGVAQDVTHGLGTTNIGYIVVRSYGANVANDIGETGTAADPTNKRRLITTLACTRDILFFKR